MSLLSIDQYPKWILNNPDIEINGGKIKLHHYGDDGGTGILQPSYFGKNPYTSDVKQWTEPRVMFYVSPEHKEFRVNGTEFEVEYDLTKLYPFNSDPLYFYEECLVDYDAKSLSVNVQLSCIGSKVKKAGFDGMIMKWDDKVRVDIWKPINVKKTNGPEKEDILELVKRIVNNNF